MVPKYHDGIMGAMDIGMGTQKRSHPWQRRDHMQTVPGARGFTATTRDVLPTTTHGAMRPGPIV